MVDIKVIRRQKSKHVSRVRALGLNEVRFFLWLVFARAERAGSRPFAPLCLGPRLLATTFI